MLKYIVYNEKSTKWVMIMTKIEDFLEFISNLIWGNWLIVALMGVGVFFTILTGFIQIKGFPLAIKELLSPKKDMKGQGTLSGVEALCTALASCVGNGNIVGVSTAIAFGGPGAVFWMWIAGIVGMATKYSEIVIGMIYREKAEDGTYVGGPMYYLSKGLGWKKISILFAGMMCLQVSGGALIQSNTVANVINEIFDITPIWGGIVMALVVLMVIVGGIKRLGRVAEFLIPFMTLLYFVGGIITIATHIEVMPQAFMNIIKYAFNDFSIGGGVLGYSVAQALRFGVSRGLYSNEAGEGSAPVIYAAAITDNPVRQGLYGLLEVFIDTIMICSLTAFIVLTSGVYNFDISPARYVIVAFGDIHPMFRYIVGISMILFAFSSMLAQWYFGKVTLGYIFNDKKAKYFIWIFAIVVVIGSISTLKLVWYLQDVLLGCMIIPNLIGIVLLSPHVIKATKEFFKEVKEIKNVD